jgi:hypothetical protein
MDVRLAIMEREVTETKRIVESIDQSLRFPEQSPVGRALIARADTNADNIKYLREDVDEHNKKLDEMEGVIKGLRLVSTLLGVIIAIYTLSQILPH